MMDMITVSNDNAHTYLYVISLAIRKPRPAVTQAETPTYQAPPTRPIQMI
jgi:hypothetical protein